MDNLRNTIKAIKEARNELKNSLMKDVIEASTDKKVISFYSSNRKHFQILDDIKKIGFLIKSQFSSSPITREEFARWRGRSINAFRNNEVGDYCEYLIKHFFDKNKREFSRIDNIILLSAKGYPDTKMIDIDGNIVYLEVKATSRPYAGSARDFYFSPGSASDRKIDKDGIHLLMGFVTKQTKIGFLITDFKIVDVSRMKVFLKPEFNTDNTGIYNRYTILYPYPKQKYLSNFNPTN